MIKTQPPTVIDLLTKTQPSTTPHPFPDLEPLETSTVPTFTELLEKYNASKSPPEASWNRLISDESSDPFAVYQKNLAGVAPKPVRWLWQDRLPLAGITLLDGDRGCGKSLLALQLAAHVSSGMPMPDGTPTIQGGVVIVTPQTDASTTQIQLLTTLGADLSRVEILSFIQAPNPEHPTSSHRPFSLPEDMGYLLDAIERVDARLVIFDPFISLLSHQHRWTDQRLHRLLSNLNQRLIEHNVACLISRNCPARGGHARPSVLERSERFLTIAPSRMLLAHDPMQPDRLLLTHAPSLHTVLTPTPTLTLHIQPLPKNSDLPHITFHGHHCLTFHDLLDNRPDVLRRRLLAQQLLGIITSAPSPLHVSTLYAQFPQNSPFQIHRSLSDLLRTEQIERPTRGFYTKPPTNPTLMPPNKTATTTSSPTNLSQVAAITSSTFPTENLNESAAITLDVPSTKLVNETATITSSTFLAKNLNESAAITSDQLVAKNLNESATITSNPSPVNNPKKTATITLKPTATKTSRLEPSRHKGHKHTKKRR
jgi:AAA domain